MGAAKDLRILLALAKMHGFCASRKMPDILNASASALVNFAPMTNAKDEHYQAFRFE
jgi:hypothetical protein